MLNLDNKENKFCGPKIGVCYICELVCQIYIDLNPMHAGSSCYTECTVYKYTQVERGEA